MKLPLLPQAPDSGLWLWKIPYLPIADLDLMMVNFDQHRPIGIVPPTCDNLADTARCMANVRGFYPSVATYAPIVEPSPRDFIRSARKAGFKHFALAYREPFPHLYQEIHDLLEGAVVHVAGGYPELDSWLEDKGLPWTWSEEGF